MLNNGPNHLSDEDYRGSPVPPVQSTLQQVPYYPPTQWPRLMKPPPFLISTAEVINYVCPTPNTNIVIFGGKKILIYFIVVAEGVRWMASHHGHLQEKEKEGLQ